MHVLVTHRAVCWVMYLLSPTHSLHLLHAQPWAREDSCACHTVQRVQQYQPSDLASCSRRRAVLLLALPSLCQGDKVAELLGAIPHSLQLGICGRCKASDTRR